MSPAPTIDGQDVRVLGGLLEHVDHRAERIIGMEQQEIVRLERFQHILRVNELGRDVGREGPVLQLRPVDREHLPEVHQAHRRIGLEYEVPGQVQFLGQHLDHPIGHVLPHLQAHWRADPSALHSLLHRGQQVRGVFQLDRYLGVPGDAEGVGGHDLQAREEEIQIRRDEVLQEDEVERRPPADAIILAQVLGDGHETGIDAHRHLHPGEELLALGVLHDDSQVGGEIGDEWEWPPGIECQRRQGRIDLPLEQLPQGAALLLIEIAPGMHVDALPLQQREQLLVPAGAMPLQDRDEVLPHLVDRLRRRQSIRGELEVAAHHLATQVRDAAHEELVQVRSADGEELDPLQQGMGMVHGLLHHSLVELQRAQLPIDEVLWVIEVLHHCRRRFEARCRLRLVLLFRHG